MTGVFEAVWDKSGLVGVTFFFFKDCYPELSIHCIVAGLKFGTFEIIDIFGMNLFLH